jgi:hypothetical protein
MDVVIYLLDNGTAVDEAVVTSEQLTPLLIAARLRDIDIIRMLLSRGAPLDHFDAFGLDAVTNCIYPTSKKRVERSKAATVDVLKVMSEFESLETNSRDDFNGTLQLAASYSSAREIDFLVGLGHKANDFDGDHRSAIYQAARRGNSATYFALLAHGAATEYLTENLPIVINAKAAPFGGVACHEFLGPPGDFDPILRDLLGRRADLLTSLGLVDGNFVDILGPAIPLQEAVKACGLSTEAWFLGLLQECGLETEEDRQRLQELRIDGYDQHGTVIGEVDEWSTDYDSGDEDPEYAGSESGRSSAGSEADDTEDDECFWDAEEGA